MQLPLKDVTYPDGLPVLAFVADDKSGSVAAKAATAQELLNNVRRHEVVTLEGGHYLHWTQSKRMAEILTTFLAAPENHNWPSSRVTKEFQYVSIFPRTVRPVGERVEGRPSRTQEIE